MLFKYANRQMMSNQHIQEAALATPLPGSKVPSVHIGCQAADWQHFLASSPPLTKQHRRHFRAFIMYEALSMAPSSLPTDKIRTQLRKLELMSATVRSGKFELARSGMLLFRNERENRVKTPREDLLERLLVNIPKARAALSAEIDRQIVAHTAPPIHALCRKLQDRLPRELRDIVYEHLLPSCDILIEATDFLPLEHAESSRPRLISFPHLLEHDYLDAITRKEYVEAWYRFCTFQFASTDLISRFLHEDLWGMGLPIRQLVRNLEIDIWHTDCMSESEYKRRPNIDQPQLLDCLLAVRSGARMVFPIDTMVRIAIWSDCEQRKREFIELLGRFFVSARRLLVAGQRVIVDVDWSLVVNLTFDDLTQAAWQRKLEDHRIETAAQFSGESEVL